MEEGKNPDIPIDPVNMPKVIGFLVVVAALIGIALLFARKGGERAEKKGYPNHFGFLLCFYFGPIGFWILDRMETNIAELRRRELEGVATTEEVSAVPPEPATPFSWEYKTKRPNFTALYVLMGLTLLCSLYLRFRTEPSYGSVDVRTVPTNLGNWKYLGDAPETEESKKQMAGISADSYVTRYYQSPDGQVIELYIVYRKYGRREFNHNPDQCFPAGGWQLTSKDVTALRYAGADRPAVHMVFDGKGVVTNLKDPATGKHKVGLPPATVTYFFASGDKTEHVFLNQQLWMALERLIPNKNGWALIRMTTIQETSDADALAAQQEFMRVYGSDIQRVITTDAAHSRMAQASP
jgi:EpsI family protein